MNSSHCRVLAARIHALLESALGAGVESERLVRDERYARDVLLVCDAMAGTEGPDLAREYRLATEAAPPAEPPQQPARMPLRVASLLNAVFGPLDEPASLPPTGPRPAVGGDPAPRRRWFGLRAPKASAADHVAGLSQGRSAER